MKKIMIIAAVLVAAAAVIAAGAYMYWKASPQYSLLQAARAVQNHDKAAFEKYVDVGGVLDGFISGAMKYSVQTAPPEDAQKMQLAMGFMTMLKPSIIEMMKGEILKSVESGNFGQGDKNASPKNPGMPDMTGGLASAQPNAMNSLKNFKKDNIQYVKKEGNTARVGLKIDGVKDITVVELLMRKQDGYWQVFGIGNLDDFFKLAAEEKAKADADAPQAESEILANLISLAYAQQRYFMVNNRFSKNIGELDIAVPSDQNAQYSLSDGTDGGWIVFGKSLKPGHRLLLGRKDKNSLCCTDIDAGRCSALAKAANQTFVPCPMAM
ncbi:MAG: DUF2939 domain-containing protein [Elusimicrobia bacterium]|nr:DUF2939 domain-containing protein [Elusimicrobiota bacterium]